MFLHHLELCKIYINLLTKFKKFNKDNMFTVTPASKNPYFNMVEVERNKVKIVKNQKKYYSRQKRQRYFL